MFIPESFPNTVTRCNILPYAPKHYSKSNARQQPQNELNSANANLFGQTQRMQQVQIWILEPPDINRIKPWPVDQSILCIGELEGVNIQKHIQSDRIAGMRLYSN